MKRFFFEKKAEPALREPKTFISLAYVAGKSCDSDVKSLASRRADAAFSSEKKVFN